MVIRGDVPALLADVAGIGPFFAVATGPEPAGGGWVPVGGLADEGPLDDRIAAVRAALGTDERVAASIAYQGLAAQLVSPLFAAAVVAGVLPGLCPESHLQDVSGPGGGFHDTRGTRAADGIAGALHWRPTGPGPALWWAGGGGVVPCPDAAQLGEVLIGLLAPLHDAVRSRVAVSPRVLWGDVASAVASARDAVCAARPDAAERATGTARQLLVIAPLAATVALGPPDRPWTFRRRSCCLYHRVPGGGLCADCVLLDRRSGGRPPPRLA